jgi:hypothetical protein
MIIVEKILNVDFTNSDNCDDRSVVIAYALCNVEFKASPMIDNK